MLVMPKRFRFRGFAQNLLFSATHESLAFCFLHLSWKEQERDGLERTLQLVQEHLSQEPEQEQEEQSLSKC